MKKRSERSGANFWKVSRRPLPARFGKFLCLRQDLWQHGIGIEFASTISSLSQSSTGHHAGRVKGICSF